MSLGLLLTTLEQIHIDRFAIVSFGMKDVHFMNNIEHIPLSDDATVCRRFDIGLNFPDKEIPFFALDDEIISTQHGKIHHMCGMLGGGGGSVKCQYKTKNANIHTATIKVYPLIVHTIKMKLKGKKQLPNNIKGISYLMLHITQLCPTLDCQRKVAQIQRGF